MPVASDQSSVVAKWLSKMPEFRSEAPETFTVTVVAPELNQHRSNQGQRLPHSCPPPCRCVMFVRNCELGARRCSAITSGRPTPTAGSTSRSVPIVAPRNPGELLHNLLHDPGLWRLARGIIEQFLRT